tara:strand:+ start:1171 stop:1737 length:567 start_codon:yes stop_codon:yes gene_type:complete
MSEKMKIITVLTPMKLRAVSKPVPEEDFGSELDAYMDKMLSIMYENDGVGLSGIQVGDPRRIMVIDPGTGPIKIVNPEILRRSEETVRYAEGCLSIPGLTAEVDRSKFITIRYRTPMGEVVEGDAENPVSVIIQHEMEHLEGKTILDSMSWMKRDMYMKKLRKVVKKFKAKTRTAPPSNKKKRKKKKR